MRLVCISDTHEQNILTKWRWPDGDILIHAGDLLAMGHIARLPSMARKLRTLADKYDYQRIFFVPGNHDKCFAYKRQESEKIMAEYGIEVLIDKSVMLGEQLLHGTPWIQLAPEDFLKLNPNALAFSRVDIRDYIDKIPIDVRILITHQPPAHILDTSGLDGSSVGSSQISNLFNYKLSVFSWPILHIFGHAHNCNGIYRDGPGRTFANVCLVDEDHRPTFQPTVIDF